MTTTSAGREQPSTRFHVPVVGWVSLALLLAEYLVLSQGFDIAILSEHDRPWSFLGRVGDAATLVFVIGAVAAAFASRTRSLLSQVKAPPRVRPSSVHWLELAAGLVCFGIGFWLSSRVLVPEAPSPGTFSAWAGAMLLWLFCRTHWAWPVGGVRGVLDRRRVWGPILAIAALSAAAGLGARALWYLQGDLVLGWVVGLLRVVGEDPIRGDGNEIWLADFGVDVAPVCSGYEGIGLMVAFVGGYLVVMRKQLVPQRAWPLLPVALIVVWLANVVRLATLTWIGGRISGQWAAGAFHSKAGWLLFCGVGLSFVWLIQRVAARDPATDGPVSSAVAGPRSTASSTPLSLDATDVPPDAPLDKATSYYLAPLVAATATGLVTGVFFEPLDRLYGLRVIVALGTLYWCGYRFTALRTGFTWQGIGTGVLVFGLWSWLSTPPPEETLQLFADQLNALGPVEKSAWFTLRLLGGVLTVPISEELAFRGFLLRRLSARRFAALDYRAVRWWALVLSSVLFGALHGSWFAGTIAGLLYAGLLRWRGRLAEATVAHMVTNFCLMFGTVAVGRLPHWQ